MEEISIRESQLGAYEVLKYIDEICRKNNFIYFLMYGSLIGAVRENGIIPWDDDIDIMMPRPDYDKLIKFCNENEKKILPFKLYENSLVSDYPHPIARMSDSRYKIEFKNEKDYGIGLFVDIYPLDGVGNDFKLAKKHLRNNYGNASLCFLTSRKKFGVDNTRSILRLLIKFPAYVWANILGNKHYINKIKDRCLKYNYEKSKYVSCIAQPYREKGDENKNIYEKEWFELTTVKFEDSLFFIPKGYDKILQLIYGDYMTPLQETERYTHHTYSTYKL